MSILWIVDRDAPNLEEGLRRVPADGPTNIVIDIHRSSQLLQTVATIRGRVQRPVSLVRFLSHGRAGELLFSNETLNISNAGGLRFLRGVISPSRLIGTAGIEFHGCGVASDYLPPPRVEQGIGNVVVQNFGNMQGQLGWGDPRIGLQASRGVRFLLAVASAAGVCVKGGIDYQLPDDRWTYEGPTVTVCPNRQARLDDPHERYGLGPFATFTVG